MKTPSKPTINHNRLPGLLEILEQTYIRTSQRNISIGHFHPLTESQKGFLRDFVAPRIGGRQYDVTQRERNLGFQSVRLQGRLTKIYCQILILSSACRTYSYHFSNFQFLCSSKSCVQLIGFIIVIHRWALILKFHFTWDIHPVIQEWSLRSLKALKSRGEALRMQCYNVLRDMTIR
jgi:hypothetical protein